MEALVAGLLHQIFTQWIVVIAAQQSGGMNYSTVISLFALLISILTAIYTLFSQNRKDQVIVNWIYQTFSDSDNPGKVYLELNIYNASSISHAITCVSLKSCSGKEISEAYRYPVLLCTRRPLDPNYSKSDEFLVYADYVPFNIEPQHSVKVVLAFLGQLPAQSFNVRLMGTKNKDCFIADSSSLTISRTELNLILDKQLGGTAPKLKSINGVKVE